MTKQAQEQVASQFYERGLNLVLAKDYDKALEMFDKALIFDIEDEDLTNRVNNMRAELELATNTINQK